MGQTIISFRLQTKLIASAKFDDKSYFKIIGRKSAGEEMRQLFDLNLITNPKALHVSNESDASSHRPPNDKPTLQTSQLLIYLLLLLSNII